MIMRKSIIPFPRVLSCEKLERIISFSDLWVSHPQRPQGHKRHLAQAIHNRSLNTNEKHEI